MPTSLTALQHPAPTLAAPRLYPALHGQLESCVVPAPNLSDVHVFPHWDVLQAFAWAAACVLRDLAVPVSLFPGYFRARRPECLVCQRGVPALSVLGRALLVQNPISDECKCKGNF